MVCFSYGVVMWEMLTAGRPHEGLTEEEIILTAKQPSQLMLSVSEAVPNVYSEPIRGKLYCMDLYTLLSVDWYIITYKQHFEPTASLERQPINKSCTT